MKMLTMVKDPLQSLDMLLMRHAARRLGPHESLLVSAAAALNGTIRQRIAQYEAHGAQLMCEEQAQLAAKCLDSVMARIHAPKDEAPAPCADKTKPCPPSPDLFIPDVVHGMISAVCAQKQKQWTRATHGILRIDLNVREQTPVQKFLKLMKMGPQFRTPRHTHSGTEITLVLHGSFSDEFGSWKKGDIVILTDPRVAHQPVAGEEGCVCLTLTESPLRFENPVTRMINTYFRV
ncbi:MAG TPA: ChrR family anti-sigma-E factor [Patescibacteria group bacterium]|nr:ChrR family anti-sigma-E factor [Patescibacteria group bacterium]